MKARWLLWLTLVPGIAAAHIGMDAGKHHETAGLLHAGGGLETWLAMAISVGIVALALGRLWHRVGNERSRRNKP